MKLFIPRATFLQDVLSFKDRDFLRATEEKVNLTLGISEIVMKMFACYERDRGREGSRLMYITL